MVGCGSPRGWAKVSLALAGLLVGMGLVGCNRQLEQPEAEGPGGADAQAAARHTIDPRWRQSFAEATRPEPVADWQPPDVTKAGKSVGKLYTEVRRLWDESKLATNEGLLVAYKAVLETDLGNIEITLRPDWAPNHVRNFVALSRAGYYDGLVFDRVHKEVSETEPDVKLELLEGGCPLGTGETGSGSIGYWLKPEFNPKVAHEAGVVGAIHEQEADTAACRFYITLTRAPLLDGNFTVFGQVTQGLDVARKVFDQPTQPDEGSANLRPVKPVVIKKVTLHTTEVENVAASAEVAKRPE